MTRAVLLFAAALATSCGQDPPKPAEEPAPKVEEIAARDLIEVRRIFVDRLSGGDTAVQIRDMIIASLEASKLFLVTENEARADAVLRGSAEDLVFTDQFQSTDSINAHASLGGLPTTSGTSSSSKSSRPYSQVSVGQNDSTRISERKHEATASVRLVNKDGDVIWSTTQESMGAKFRGASADVADKITRRLKADLDQARRPKKPAEEGKK